MSSVINGKSVQASTIIKAPESITRQWVETTFKTLPHDITIDFEATKSLDSSAIALLYVLQKREQTTLQNLSKPLQSILDRWAPQRNQQSEKEEKISFFEKIGYRVELMAQECITLLSIFVEMFYWGTIGLLKKRDIKPGALGDEMYQLGYKAIGIVSLLSFLIGIVLSVQASMTLDDYGAEIFLAQMISYSMIYEFGPLMTAVILSGRSGSATTAEIATMCVQEEMDALKTMAIHPIQFVVVPKFWAISITMPLLSMLGTAIGMVAGYCVAIWYLDLPSKLFIGEMMRYVIFAHVRAGLIKSLVFAWLIVWIGAYFGFKVRGGAEEVGKATTASVVSCLFAIILADAVFSFIL